MGGNHVRSKPLANTGMLLYRRRVLQTTFSSNRCGGKGTSQRAHKYTCQVCANQARLCHSRTCSPHLLSVDIAVAAAGFYATRKHRMPTQPAPSGSASRSVQASFTSTMISMITVSRMRFLVPPGCCGDNIPKRFQVRTRNGCQGHQALSVTHTLRAAIAAFC